MVTWYLDDGIHLDSEYTAVIEGELEFDADITFQYSPLAEDAEIEIEVELEVSFQHSVAIDLLSLIPEKYKNTNNWEILEAYVKECAFQFGDVMTKTKDIVKLLSPNTINDISYLRNLGSLMGLKFPPEDETDIIELRKILSQAIEWYKLKGSYQSVQIVCNSQSFNINLYDMYSNDYTSFILTDWFVGDEGENPPGLDSSYYKTPHFGLEVILDQVYTDGSLRFLWISDYLDNLIEQIEEVRPVHTVPHYLLLLNPKTDEFGNVIETDSEIRAKVTENWEYGTQYFDAIGLNSWNFDDSSMTFDSDQTSYIKSITKWVLGTGNYPSGIDSSGASLETPVLTGIIDLNDINIYTDRYEFEFIVPKAIVQNHISELGLYIPGSPDKLVLLSSFPKINKANNVELRVLVQVYKKDLLNT